MKKTILSILGWWFIVAFCFSQDVISLKNGGLINSKILEVKQNEITYKKFDNINGPVYSINKSEIISIQYENGSKDVFENEPSNIITTQSNTNTSISVSNESPKSSPELLRKKLTMGFNLALPSGFFPANALRNGGTRSMLNAGNLPVKSHSFGFIVQYNLSNNLSIFLDGNTYNYNEFIGKMGTDVQSIWTVAEGATHWDEPGAPQILYVHNLPTDVYYDVSSTGFRLGGKFYFLKSKIRPWIGAGYGFYRWDVNYCNKEKDRTYGQDGGYVTGLTVLAGIEIEVFPGLTIAPFVDAMHPVVEHNIEGLFYPQWNAEDWDTEIMLPYRFGFSLLF